MAAALKNSFFYIGLTTMISASAFAAEQNRSSFIESSAENISKSKPAVDGVNGKLDIYGGASQTDFVRVPEFSGLPPLQPANLWKDSSGVTGTISVPLSHSFGAQFDVGSGVYGNRVMGDASAHVFWRDPDKGLVGAYGSGQYLSGQIGSGVWRGAGEFESYIGSFTGRALIGIQGQSQYSAGVNTQQYSFYDVQSIFYSPNRFFDHLELTYYPIQDLALSVGHIYSFGMNGVTSSAEYLLPQFSGKDAAPAVYVETNYAWNNAASLVGGLRVYFGNKPNSLIRRQREDVTGHPFGRDGARRLYDPRY